jgi:hypothetical protein
MVNDKQEIKDLLVATRFGVSASEMPSILGVEQDRALEIIHEMIKEGEDIHSLGGGDYPEEQVLYSIGEIEP